MAQQFGLKMTKRKTTLLIVACIIVVALGSVSLHAVSRWLALRNILTNHEWVAMLAVIPEPKIEVTPISGLPLAQISLGYAEFALPPDVPINTIYRAAGELVLLEADRLWLGFSPPGYRDTTELLISLKELANKSSEGGMWGSLLSEDNEIPARANIVDLHMLAAVTRPLPFVEVLKMGDAEFKAYHALLILKTMLCPPSERILPYEATNSIGVIYFIGRNHGHIQMTSHDRKIQQTIRFDAKSEIEIPVSFLANFLASYRFTLDSCPSRERIAELLAATGIPFGHPEEDLADSD